MIDLLYDCDLTMGLPGRDVDDGLALLYLLGRPDVRLAGVTSTFGNSTLAEVHPCLLGTLRELGVAGVPVCRGAASPQARRGSRDSPAARFLAGAVKAYPGRLSLLATGSLTNLLGAARIEPGFFAGLKQIVLMGGITAPLLLAGRLMPELNFAADPEAAAAVLRSGARVGVITGNLCLSLLFERRRCDGLLQELRDRGSSEFAAYLAGKLLPWFEHIRDGYGLSGFHAWDATAAVYLTHPSLFDGREWLPASAPADLAQGLLRPQAVAPGQPTVTIPAGVLDPQSYWRLLLQAWRRFAGRFPHPAG